MNYEIVHDCDSQDDKPTCWATKDEYNNIWWIDLKNDHSYMVTTKLYGEVAEIQSCKTMKSAKRWITTNYKKYADKH